VAAWVSRARGKSVEAVREKCAQVREPRNEEVGDDS
jgi:hypothetical protein